MVGGCGSFRHSIDPFRGVGAGDEIQVYDGGLAPVGVFNPHRAQQLHAEGHQGAGVSRRGDLRQSH
jgi:hypothetical protein